MALGIIAALSSISLFNNSEDPTPSGAEAVRTAVNEIQHFQDRKFEAVLGEPDISVSTGFYFTNPKVVIPVEDAPYDSVNQLVFELPQSGDLDRSQFGTLLTKFDLDIDTMESLEGKTVPVWFFGGNPVVNWSELFDKEGEEEPHTEESIEDSVFTEESVTPDDDE